ncbi:hypothetical protein DFP72DRAFT_1067418 [Ephemerocybe angulata]|uniref:RING-type domain-containing protein n=1 Tax=Ephemerocybe angulata TaxID=980116 RepID=A0A8H6I1E1_9AGAR|nr:hypothetical protein DFP72DRAFT_1067418 [Tulosesus angulatus]
MPLPSCKMCETNIDPVHWPGYRSVCNHIYCQDCYSFLTHFRFPCLDSCRTAPLNMEDGVLLKMVVVTTTEEEDNEVVSQYQLAAEFQHQSTKSQHAANMPVFYALDSAVDNQTEVLVAAADPLKDALLSQEELIVSLEECNRMLDESTRRSNDIYEQYKQAQRGLDEARTALCNAVFGERREN